MRFPALALALGLFAAPAVQAADVYGFDPGHTEVRATWNHVGFSNQSLTFRQIDGGVVIDLDNPANSSVDITIPITGLDTGVDALNKHMLSGEMFDADSFPAARFVSTSVEKTGEMSLKVTGDLTLKDATKPVTLDVTINKIGENPVGQFLDYYKGQWVGVTASTTITRSDWGINYGVPMFSDQIEILINAEMKAGL